MKRVIAIILTCVLALWFACANAEDERFIDEESGVSFAIPSGWIEVPNLDGNEAIKNQYTPEKATGQVTIALAVLDLYSAMNMSQYGVSRKDIDFTFLDDDLITAIMGPLEVKSDEVKKYGNYQYRVIGTSLERTKAGLKFSFNCEVVVTLANGYVILFQYMEMNHSDEYHAVFENILSSVQMK